jgi:o-succinylbenzoate---CoA ligase
VNPHPPNGHGASTARRPLRAVLLNGTGDAARLITPLAAALDGTGPAILPIDATLPPSKVRQLIEAFQPDAVIEADGATSGRPGAPGVTPDTAVIIGTSGSTGEPKGVELSAAALTHSARASLSRVGARDGERWLCCLPVSHVAGLQVLVRSLLSGTEPVVEAEATARAVGDAADRGCAHVSIVPTQLVRLLADEEGTTQLARYKSVLVGGAAAGAAALDQAQAAGINVVTTYGMSETCGGCVYDGVPLDGVEVRAGADGRLRIAGPVLMNRYHGRPDLTATVLEDRALEDSVPDDSPLEDSVPDDSPTEDSALEDSVPDDSPLEDTVLEDTGSKPTALKDTAQEYPGPDGVGLSGTEFVTSDLGFVADGRVVVRGRADDVIITGGHKVVPGEVAAALSDCPGVREVVVIGRPDPEWGERVTAVVVPSDPADPPGLELLRTHVRTKLPRYACPSEVVLAEAIPVLPSGKPDLAALKVART